MRPPGDHRFIQIVDATLARAYSQGGARLACRPGCAYCCCGPFEINALDALRLREGLARLVQSDPTRAAALLERSRQAQGGEDDPCPALDPVTSACDLYEHRPLTCRAFGPPVLGPAGAIGLCELCYTDATDAEIAQAAVALDPDGLEESLLAQLPPGETTVAAAILNYR